MNTSRLVASAILAAVAIPALSQAGPAPVPNYTSEKCFGVNAKGSNDCAAAVTPVPARAPKRRILLRGSMFRLVRAPRLMAASLQRPNRMEGRPARPGLGIGLRQPHIQEVLARRPSDIWFEVHAENFMYDEHAARALERIRHYASLSLHGVALSLGSSGDLNAEHLSRLKRLVDRFDPFLISEHLAWSAVDGAYLNDLLPLPYTEESLNLMESHVNHAQGVLGRRILVENPARYLIFRHSTIDESVFLAELSNRTGCGLLCDLNNIYVSAANLKMDAEHYLTSLPTNSVAEIHLAGHSTMDTASGAVLIDDHGSEVSLSVWALYYQALNHFGPLPTLIEWDNDLPSLYVLLKEAGKGRALLEHWTASREFSAPASRVQVSRAT